MNGNITDGILLRELLIMEQANEWMLNVWVMYVALTR